MAAIAETFAKKAGGADHAAARAILRSALDGEPVRLDR
jgi:cytochrome c-type biogenesis protein CcmH/NrfG